MRAKQIYDEEKFIEAARTFGRPVRISERAIPLHLTEQGQDVVRPALERHYTVEVKDHLDRDLRLIFEEYLVVRDEIPFDTSFYEKLKRHELRVIEVGHISRAA